MNNVVRLAARRKADVLLSEPDAPVAAAITAVLAMREQLSQNVKEFLKQFDSIEHHVDTVEDAETRMRYRNSIAQSRETMLKAIFELSRQIETLVGRLGA